MQSSATIPQMKTVPQVSQTSQTITYFVAVAALGLTTASLGPTLQGLADQTHASLKGISFLFTARSLGFLIGSFILSHLYDRHRGHRVMAMLLLVMAVMMAFVPLTAKLLLLALIMLTLGTAEGTLDVGVNTLIQWVHKEKVAPYMNGLHFFYGVGAVLSPLIVAQAMRAENGTAVAYFVLALLTLPGIFLLLRVASPQTLLSSQGGLVATVNYRLVVLIAFFFFLYLGAEIGFSGWIAKFAVNMNLSDETGAGYFTAAFWGAYTGGRLLSIPLAAKLGPRAILVGDLTGCCASLALIFLLPASFAAVLAGTIGTGFFMASIFPTAMTFAGRRVKITGRVTGWFLIGASLGAMFLPWLIGQLFERAGAPVMVLITLIDLLLALAILITTVNSEQ